MLADTRRIWLHNCRMNHYAERRSFLTYALPTITLSKMFRYFWRIKMTNTYKKVPIYVNKVKKL